MRKAVQRLKNERGLTLVELLAVIVILAIVAVIAFVFIGGVIENSKKDAHIANAQQIITAAKMHEATGGKFPATGNDVVTVKYLIEQKYLDKVLDPWDKKGYGGDATVVKDGNDFRIKNFSVSGKCSLGGADGVTENELNTEDRETLCKK